mgnify:CR=1 FL=1|tara:strand:- start:118 stop:651 length:534 start_codon:yes stop_codon:yes gene_type:complete
MTSIYSSVYESYSKPTISLDNKKNIPLVQKLRKPSISLNTPKKVTKKQKGVKKPKVAKKAAKKVAKKAAKKAAKKTVKKVAKKTLKKVAINCNKISQKSSSKVVKKTIKKAAEKVSTVKSAPKGAGAVTKLAKIKPSKTKSSSTFFLNQKYKSRETFEYALIFTILVTIFGNKLLRS